MGEVWYSLESAARKNKKGKSFNFARFENIPEGSVQLVNPPVTEEREDSDDNADLGDVEPSPSNFSGGRFENPLYRSKEIKKTDNIDESISLSALQDNEAIEEIEIEIENF